MGKFSEDLKKGEKFELNVIEILNNNGFSLVKNPNKRGIDLLIVDGGIECKMDEYAKYSGNFYIEYEYNGKPSGILKEEDYKIKYWAHSDGDYIYLADAEVLRHFVEQHIKLCQENKSLSYRGFRIIENGGNGGRTKGLIIPVDKFSQICPNKYNLTKK